MAGCMADFNLPRVKVYDLVPALASYYHAYRLASWTSELRFLWNALRYAFY